MYIVTGIPASGTLHLHADEPFTHGGLGQLGDSEIGGAIATAQRELERYAALQQKLAAGAGTTNDGTAARKAIAEYWKWDKELRFLTRLKAVHEMQGGKGVALAHDQYPVTQTDPKTGRVNRNLPWRATTTRQSFRPKYAGTAGERHGSFCHGTSRAVAFRSIFGEDRPSYRSVLTDLRATIDAAKKSGDIAAEARALISRIVSHTSDPGSLAQLNQDILSRYRIKNARLRSGTRKQAVAALKLGAPVVVSLNSEWHWIMVQRSPRGQLWASDPLESAPKRISTTDLGSRFELIVDATTDQPITVENADAFKN